MADRARPTPCDARAERRIDGTREGASASGTGPRPERSGSPRDRRRRADAGAAPILSHARTARRDGTCPDARSGRRRAGRSGPPAQPHGPARRRRPPRPNRPDRTLAIDAARGTGHRGGGRAREATLRNPENRFKAALKAGRQQIGVWSSLGGPVAAEVLASRGFDWIVIDTEHAPLEVSDVLAPLQAIAAYPGVSAVVRPAINDWVLIKRFLDLGAQTLLLPYVQSAEEAEAAVRAMRYAPRGARGVAGMTRASRYGLVEGYATSAEDELCLIVQVETRTALDALEAIATVEGVDGVFIGPSDLAASLGFPGQPMHPEVVAAIEDAIGRLKAAGVPAGILAFDPAFARRCIELGTGFTAVGADLGLLIAGATALARDFGTGGA